MSGTRSAVRSWDFIGALVETSKLDDLAGSRRRFHVGRDVPIYSVKTGSRTHHGNQRLTVIGRTSTEQLEPFEALTVSMPVSTHCGVISADPRVDESVTYEVGCGTCAASASPVCDVISLGRVAGRTLAKRKT